MKPVSLIYLTLIVIGCLFIESCTTPCDPSITVSRNLGTQFFTVEYRDSLGRNYLDSIYNRANVAAFVDTTGGENVSYRQIIPGYANGKFGPFYYTEGFIDPVTGDPNLDVLLRNTFTYDYLLRKDSYGVDTLSVMFTLNVNECTVYWDQIDFFKNSEPLGSYSMQEAAEILIVE